MSEGEPVSLNAAESGFKSEIGDRTRRNWKSCTLTMPVAFDPALPQVSGCCTLEVA